jgi:hypothetical protein
MGYRKAWAIELIDTGVSLALDEHDGSESLLPGQADYGERPAFKIPAVDLVKLVNMLGYGNTIDENASTPIEGCTDQDLAYGKSGESRRVDLPDYQINIMRHVLTGDNWETEVMSLDIEVIDSRMINLKVGVIWKGDTDVSFYDMSYSGNFMIWWAPMEAGNPDKSPG